jgi:hypothetical protein
MKLTIHLFLMLILVSLYVYLQFHVRHHGVVLKDMENVTFLYGVVCNCPLYRISC